jgi:hypothetical protein
MTKEKTTFHDYLLFIEPKDNNGFAYVLSTCI